MATQTRNLTVTFLLHNGIKQPEMEEKGHFYKIYSTEKIKLRPRDDYHLDLKFNIETPKELSPWLNILPLLKGMGLSIEDHDWKDNKIKQNTIQLHLLNKSFIYTVNINEKQCIGYIFLLGERYNDKITTEYILKR